MDTPQDEVNLSSQKKHYSKLHSLKILVSNYLNAQYNGIKNILFLQPKSSEINNEVEQLEKSNEVEKLEKNRELINSPSTKELEKYYTNAMVRSVKQRSKELCYKEEYLKYANTIVEDCLRKHDNGSSYILIKTICLACLRQMTDMHNGIILNMTSEEKVETEAIEYIKIYQSDKTKLELADEIIKEILWGEYDWYQKEEV